MKNSKKLIMIIAIIVVAIVAVIVIAVSMGVGGKSSKSSKKSDDPTKDGYREIVVYEIDGIAKVTREGIGEMDAYADMQLESKDAVATAEESYLQMLMDEDKYLMLEPESKLSLEASGDSQDSLTYITLEKGAITNTLENPLSEDSTYEINTPNATMAIRGTTFRIVVEKDENGNVYTTLSVFEGNVECHLVMPDGSVDAESIIVQGGKEACIRSDENITEYEYDDNDVDYSALTIKVLRFLAKMVEETGAELSLSIEELEELIDEKMCEVTFTYQQNVFGKQKVDPDTVINAPKLCPSESGAWDYDFSKKITEDTTIHWIEKN